MALETLKDVKEIGGFKVKHVNQDFDGPIPNYLTGPEPIVIDSEEGSNWIAFKIQRGPIKEVGINGCQIDDIIDAAMMILKGLNEKHYCVFNENAIDHLQDALYELDNRKSDRMNRNVEGTNKE